MIHNTFAFIAHEVIRVSKLSEEERLRELSELRKEIGDMEHFWERLFFATKIFLATLIISASIVIAISIQE